MEADELKQIWQAYDKKIEEARILNLQSWVLNFRAFESIQMQKAKSKLGALLTVKWIAVILGIAWVAFLVYLIYHSLSYANIFFVASASIVAIITSIAIVVYIRHIVILYHINNCESITETQKKLASLQLSTLWIVRILLLQMPFYTTFFYTPYMIMHEGLRFWLISLPVTLLFGALAVWLYKNINFKNEDKKWFKLLFNSIEWTSITKAKQFIKEIEDFKNDRQ